MPQVFIRSGYNLSFVFTLSGSKTLFYFLLFRTFCCIFHSTHHYIYVPLSIFLYLSLLSFSLVLSLSLSFSIFLYFSLFLSFSFYFSISFSFFPLLSLSFSTFLSPSLSLSVSLSFSFSIFSLAIPRRRVWWSESSAFPLSWSMYTFTRYNLAQSQSLTWTMM